MVLLVTSYVAGRERKSRTVSTVSNNILSITQYSLSGFNYHFCMPLFPKASRPVMRPTHSSNYSRLSVLPVPGYSGWNVKPATHLLVPRLRVSGVMPSFPHMPPLAGAGTSLPLTL